LEGDTNLAVVVGGGHHRLVMATFLHTFSDDDIFDPHSKKITEPMLSNWILHQWHFHWGNTCLFLPPTTCFTVTVNEIKDTQFVLLI
jgi:hypothetical protein